MHFAVMDKDRKATATAIEQSTTPGPLLIFVLGASAHEPTSNTTLTLTTPQEHRAPASLRFAPR